MNLTFSKYPKFRYEYYNYLIKQLKLNGWTEKKYEAGGNYDLCDNSPHSVIQNYDYSRYHFWSNKFHLNNILKNKYYNPKTYEIISGNWLDEKPNNNGIYFVKNPGKDANRGNNIFKNIDDIIKFSKENKKTMYIVQPSIKPLLIKKKKFDIRILGTLISTNHIDFDLYIFKRGQIRMSTSEYNSESKSDLIHFTNYSVHKKIDKTVYEFYVGCENYVTMMMKIVRVCRDLYTSTIHLFKNPTKYNKQLIWNIGFDFIFDTDLNIYLLEINHNPSLNNFFPSLNPLGKPSAKSSYSPL